MIRDLVGQSLFDMGIDILASFEYDNAYADDDDDDDDVDGGCVDAAKVVNGKSAPHAVVVVGVVEGGADERARGVSGQRVRRLLRAPDVAREVVESDPFQSREFFRFAV